MLEYSSQPVKKYSVHQLAFMSVLDIECRVSHLNLFNYKNDHERFQSLLGSQKHEKHPRFLLHQGHGQGGQGQLGQPHPQGFQRPPIRSLHRPLLSLKQVQKRRPPQTKKTPGRHPQQTHQKETVPPGITLPPQKQKQSQKHQRNV